MHGAAQEVKASYSVLPENRQSADESDVGLAKSVPRNTGSPSSAGRKAAASSSTRSMPRNSNKSRPK